MAALTLVLIVILTSVGAYVVAARRLGLRRTDLPWAILQTLDYLGLAVIFLLCNVALGLMLIVGVRAVTGQFLSVYTLNDATLPVLSLLQALVLHCWRARSS